MGPAAELSLRNKANSIHVTRRICKQLKIKKLDTNTLYQSVLPPPVSANHMGNAIDRNSQHQINATGQGFQAYIAQQCIQPQWIVWGFLFKEWRKLYEQHCPDVKSNIPGNTKKWRCLLASIQYSPRTMLRKCKQQFQKVMFSTSFE